MRPARYTISVDFDGVLHSYKTPWRSESVIPDPPVDGAIAWLNRMSESFDVVIWTTRARSYLGRRAVRNWLFAHGYQKAYEVAVTNLKKPSLVYIDDRAMRFEGLFPSVHEIHRLRPWNKDS